MLWDLQPTASYRYRGKGTKFADESPEDVELEDSNQEATVGESSQPADEPVEEQAAEENAVVPSDIPADEGYVVEQMETN